MVGASPGLLQPSASAFRSGAAVPSHSKINASNGLPDRSAGSSLEAASTCHGHHPI